MTTQKKTVYRLTKSRTTTIESILHIINHKIRQRDQQSLRRALLEESLKDDKEELKVALAKLDDELTKMYLPHDVLRTVYHHSDELMLKRRCKVERTWKNEWDIPIEVFNEGINGVFIILDWHREHIFAGPEEEYNEQLALLTDLKKFRNQEK